MSNEKPAEMATLFSAPTRGSLANLGSFLEPSVPGLAEQSLRRRLLKLTASHPPVCLSGKIVIGLDQR